MTVAGDVARRSGGIDYYDGAGDGAAAPRGGGGGVNGHADAEVVRSRTPSEVSLPAALLSRSLLTQDAKRLVLVMVGMPARGKCVVPCESRGFEELAT